MYLSVACDDRISRKLLFFHAEVGAGVFHKLIIFDKRTRIHEKANTLSSCKFALKQTAFCLDIIE